MEIEREQIIRFFWDFDVNHKFPNQRLGQAFMNHFDITEPDPELFYEANEKKAKEYIKERYLNTES